MTNSTFDLAQARRHLSRRDPLLGKLMRRSIACELAPRKSANMVAELAETIVYQQLSGRAAATIFGRVRALYKPRRFPTPEQLQATPDAKLRAAGLSAAKTAALKDLARHALAGSIPTFAKARRMTDEDLIEQLTKVRGVGVWTVQMLLMFRLGRPDVLPVADLGVRKGFQVTYGLGDLPDAEAITTHAERWRPYRSVASWYMWRALG